MRFQRSGPYHELSDCGRYSVAAYKHDGRFMFQAFRVTAGEPGQVFYTHSDAKRCREACERDAQGLFPVEHEVADCA